MPKKIILLFFIALLAVFISLPCRAEEPSSSKYQLFTIYFEAGGGAGIPVIASTTSSGRLSTLPTPTMSGYQFEGWYTDELEGDKVTVNTEFSADTTIYARWFPLSSSDSTSSSSGSSSSSGTFQLKSHIGTLLVAGTVLVLLVVVYS